MKSSPGFLVLFGALLVMAASLPERRSESDEQEGGGESATETVLGESDALEVGEENTPVGFTMVTTKSTAAERR
ncbi:MAG: hypothetical protein O3A87_04925 [Verrucomicrobia bacterium]|nr:hypothetical protein [Verrucomicrobiota bacterium]MDA1005811.1 hypothetical protein [Verrucomicrobiota bacterium]